jgi:sugar phosphate isomerase/epimerase
MAAGSLAVPLLSDKLFANTQSDRTEMQIRLFSKPLDGYDFDFICECAALSGVGGLDLTVRPGGKVEPAKVETDLPELIEKARSYNLITDMIVTGIASYREPYTTSVLKTASEHGVKYYRLGWFEYDFKKGVIESIQQYRKDLTGIAEINRKYKIVGCCQNHAGSHIGAPVWDLHELFRDLSPDVLGSQYDVRHAMVEGTDTWMIGMRLIASHIKTLAIKDFTWKTIDGRPQPVTVPMGEGMVDWDIYFNLVKELGLNVPITLHAEYPLLEKSEEKLTLLQKQEIITKKLKKDVYFINTYLRKYQL